MSTVYAMPDSLKHDVSIVHKGSFDEKEENLVWPPFDILLACCRACECTLATGSDVVESVRRVGAFSLSVEESAEIGSILTCHAHRTPDSSYTCIEMSLLVHVGRSSRGNRMFGRMGTTRVRLWKMMRSVHCLCMM